MRRVFIPHELTALAGQLPAGRLQTLRGSTMGTTWTVKFVDSGFALTAVESAIQEALDIVVDQMSTWLPTSDISRFNEAAAGSWHALSADFYCVLDCALTLAKETDGAFDPTVAPLVNLWGFGPQSPGPYYPTAAQVEAALAATGWRRLTLDSTTRRLQQPGGVTLDFSGIAKGYGVDKVCVALRQLGLSHYLVEVGGELAGAGIKPDGFPWWVTLERPPHSTLPEAAIALHGLAVATSGDYRRYFKYAGRCYAHTMDPRTGYPVQGAARSVSVLHAQCMYADALATALLVMGLDAGLAYAEAHAVAAAFVDNSGAEHCTAALLSMLT